MAFLGLLVFAALMIPVVVVLVDSPIGRAVARRLEGPDQSTAAVVDLVRKVEALEVEVDELSRAVEVMREENQFHQKLIEESPGRRLLPPRQHP
jgi:hypothetical protein